MNSIVVVCLALAAVAQAHFDWANLKHPDITPPVKGLPLWSRLSSGRVVGGEEAVPHSRPYQAALFITLNDGQTVFCGGSLISTTVVLTAAHCADGVKSIDVLLGAHNIRETESTQVRITSTNFIVHEKWSSLLIHDDIALIILPEAVELNENIQLAKLPSHADQSNSFVDTDATVSGWGKEFDSSTAVSPVLRFVSNPVISNLKCSLSFPLVIRSSHLCVSGQEGKSACNGDSGGPLTVSENGQEILVGCVSFGQRKCETNHPAVYTRITSYLSWIEKNAGITIN